MCAWLRMFVCVCIYNAFDNVSWNHHLWSWQLSLVQTSDDEDGYAICFDWYKNDDDDDDGEDDDEDGYALCFDWYKASDVFAARFSLGAFSQPAHWVVVTMNE